ncbi:MAG: hypothetical protein WBG73_09885 [Coleofasciculaceae cyanobacterium]
MSLSWQPYPAPVSRKSRIIKVGKVGSLTNLDIPERLQHHALSTHPY